MRIGLFLVLWLGAASAAAETPFVAQARGKYALGTRTCAANPERCPSAAQQAALGDYARQLWGAWAGREIPGHAGPESRCTVEDICDADHPPAFLMIDRTSSGDAPNAAAMISQEADGRCVKVVLITASAYSFLFPGGVFNPRAASTLLAHEVGHHLHAACIPRKVTSVPYDETFADLCGADLATRMGVSVEEFARSSCQKFSEPPNLPTAPSFPEADLRAGRCSQRLRETAPVGEVHGAAGCRHRRNVAELNRLAQVSSGQAACRDLTARQVLEACTECVTGPTPAARRAFCQGR